MSIILSPAEIAAAQAQERVNACLDDGRSFRLEAGAGAGKTYSLVKALKRLIDRRGIELIQKGQKIACITFTEVARDEIAHEIAEHPAILVETIHAFCWSVMGQFQNALRELLAAQDKRQVVIQEGGGLGQKTVEYNLGFFRVSEEKISLSHDDIPEFMAQLLTRPKFRDRLKQLYPVIFIDEYQDTDQDFMSAISQQFFQTNTGPQIGLFGDHWQTIYGAEFNLVEFPVEGIDKGSNFRSAPVIVNVLNELRPELIQVESDPSASGEARFFHANSYQGLRTNTAHSKFDVPAEIASHLMQNLFNRLASDGWDLSPAQTKVLMLTHSALAAELGYPTIAKLFKRNEAFAKKEDPTIEFFANILEPLCQMYANQKYGEMFKTLGSAPTIRAHADKASWRESMNRLNELRLGGTIGEVLDHLKESQRPRLTDRVTRKEQDVASYVVEIGVEEPSGITRQKQLRAIPYCEVIELVKYIEGKTPFATQHSVKGAEFENVLVVLGGGWNQYNWPQLLDLLESKNITEANTKGFHRARNLFYVAVSRPKKRLAVLATQKLSDSALITASRLFGSGNVESLSIS